MKMVSYFVTPSRDIYLNKRQELSSLLGKKNEPREEKEYSRG